jgi:multidrug efflux pump subunit AcrA (membrane-fusion protein)
VKTNVGTPTEVVAVPTSALFTERGQTYVFMATSPTRFEPRVVQTGRTEGGLVEVLRGLPPKARIATRGVYYLKGAQRRPSAADGHGGHPH